MINIKLDNLDELIYILRVGESGRKVALYPNTYRISNSKITKKSDDCTCDVYDSSDASKIIRCWKYYLSNIINKNNFDDLDRLMDYKKIMSEKLNT